MTAGRIVRFALAGTVSTGVYYGLYVLLHEFLPYLGAHILAFCLAMIGSFFMNCYFTFRVRPTWKKFALFPLSNLTNFVIITVGLYLLVSKWHMNSTVAPLVAAAIAIPITFVVAQFILAERRHVQARHDAHDDAHTGGGDPGTPPGGLAGRDAEWQL